jgi:hypothetical protein
VLGSTESHGGNTHTPVCDCVFNFSYEGNAEKIETWYPSLESCGPFLFFPFSSFRSFRSFRSVPSPLSNNVRLLHLLRNLR